MIDLYFERSFTKEYRIGLVYCHDKLIKNKQIIGRNKTRMNKQIHKKDKQIIINKDNKQYS